MEGQWDEDEDLEGYGQLINWGGVHYIGEWKGGNYHGQGKRTYLDGTIDEGTFVKGYFKGK